MLPFAACGGWEKRRGEYPLLHPPDARPRAPAKGSAPFAIPFFYEHWKALVYALLSVMDGEELCYTLFIMIQ
jgi:hypothetical protein